MRNWERYEEAKRLRDTGLTLKEVGLALGVSADRVRQMLAALQLKARPTTQEEQKAPPRLAASALTLRDYFAARALNAVISNEEEIGYWCEEYSPDEAWEFSAKRAYKIADAMLRAREKPTWPPPVDSVSPNNAPDE